MIQRYDADWTAPDDAGEFVKFADHQATLARLLSDEAVEAAAHGWDRLIEETAGTLPGDSRTPFRAALQAAINAATSSDQPSETNQKGNQDA